MSVGKVHMRGEQRPSLHRRLTVELGLDEPAMVTWSRCGYAVIGTVRHGERVVADTDNWDEVTCLRCLGARVAMPLLEREYNKSDEHRRAFLEVVIAAHEWLRAHEALMQRRHFEAPSLPVEAHEVKELAARKRLEVSLHPFAAQLGRAK